MDLPPSHHRLLSRLQLFSLPGEAVSFTTRRTTLALHGRKFEELGQHLPATLVWNERGQSEEEAREERNKFFAELQGAPSNVRFVLKVDGTSRARGVTILRGGDVLPRSLFVVAKTRPCVGQAYIENPSLIEGYKWDSRVYLLVVAQHLGDGVPPRYTAFRYQDGFARRCSHVYDTSSDNRCAHVTNTAVNNKCGDLEILEEAVRICTTTIDGEHPEQPSLILSPEEYKDALEKLKQRMDRTTASIPISQTLSKAWEALEGTYTTAQIKLAQDRLDELLIDYVVTSLPQNSSDATLLEYRTQTLLLGADIIFDKSLKPLLLEVNRDPDMSCYSMDQLRIKLRLLCDTVKLAYPKADLDLLFKSSSSRLDTLWAETWNPSISKVQEEIPPVPTLSSWKLIWNSQSEPES